MPINGSTGFPKMKVTPQTILEKKQKGEKIVALTAYDYPSARLLEEQSVDIILVGDSVGMVLLGYDNTVPVTMADMLHHTRAVSRAVKNSLLIADMPYGSYDTPDGAVRNASVLVREGGAMGVKLEGGSRIREQIQALRGAGIEVMGHIGMLPQSVSGSAGFKVQGRKPEDASALVREAKLLDELGVLALILECVPKTLGASITKQVRCPTIGIGAGPDTDGQILVLHDLLGFKGKVRPRFVRAYADLEEEIKRAVAHYRLDVLAGNFPSEAESYS